MFSKSQALRQAPIRLPAFFVDLIDVFYKIALLNKRVRTSRRISIFFDFSHLKTNGKKPSVPKLSETMGTSLGFLWEQAGQAVTGYHFHIFFKKIK